MEKVIMKFKDAPIGARFYFPDESLPKEIYVKVSDGDDGVIAEWNGNIEGHQSMCSWVDEENGCDFDTEIELVPDLGITQIDSTSKISKLPANWVIDTEKEKDSPLMPKFMEWFEKNKTIEKGINKYLGRWGNHISDWPNRSIPIPVVTLEQWHEAYFPEWQPKQGERVLARKNGDNWFERVFIVKYNSFYFCEKLNCTDELLGFCEIKPLPKESQLQPRIDELKSEAEKLGLKIEIIIS